MPYVEHGEIILIGATTENPSFEIIRALLSRSRVFVLKSLGEEDLVQVIKRALDNKERGLGNIKIKIDDEVIKSIVFFSGGDARTALNILELTAKLCKNSEITKSDVKEAAQKVNVVFDKQGEEFYNLISALHKSMRGSDPDAAVLS